MSIKAMKQAYAVPLIEQLESVPTDARMMYEHDKFHHQNIPVGRLCHEAATALRQAIKQAEKQEPVIPAGVINAIRNAGLTLIKTSQGYVLQRIEGIKAQTAAPVHASDISAERVDETAKDRHEPVAWLVDGEIKLRLDMAGKLYYSESNVYGKDVVDEAIEQEREACAKVCEEDLCDAYLRQGKPARDEAMLCAAIADCANAIRARGEK